MINLNRIIFCVGIVVVVVCILLLPVIIKLTPVDSDPTTREELTCTDILEVKTNLDPIKYPLLAEVTGKIKSNCNYPVRSRLNLRIYDKNFNQIYRDNAAFTDVVINLKPDETKSYTMNFDRRIIPQNNVRDPNRDVIINVEVTASVIEIVSPEDATTW